MSCLIVASVKQRLARVGTCLVAHRHYRATTAIISSSEHKCQRSCHSCDPLFSRQFTTTSGPMLTRALARHGKVAKDPELEYRQLIEEATGLEDKMKEVKGSSTLPLITVPLHLEKRLERKMRNDSTKSAIRKRIVEASRAGNQTQVIIHCKRKEFNHYNGQSYGARDQVPLASAKWSHRKSAGDFFTLFPGFKRKATFHMTGSESITFKDLGICKALCENVTNLGIKTPTHIQVFSIPQLLKGGYNLLAAETGCGKTLAYLLPIIHQIVEDRKYRVRAKPGCPSHVILAPSRELADQIHRVAIRLCANLDVTVKLLQGGNLPSKLSNPPQSNTVDILVATTNALKVLLSAGTYGTGNILHVVLDEADTLLDDSFFPELVGPFLQRLPWGDLHRQLQLTLVSATLPKELKNTIGQFVNTDKFYEITTPGLHYSMPHVPQQFIRIQKSKKAEKIKELIKADVENKVPVLIFCNKSKTCDWLSHYLNGEGYDCVSVHGRMPLKFRKGRVELYQNGEINVLISTDLASRGIDTVRTQHVINYEFPLFMADYIHRCGRTGRVGSEKGCHVTNFISRGGEIRTVNEIELSVRKEKELPDVNANIKRLYGLQYGSFTEIKPIQNDEELEDDSESDEENDSLAQNQAFSTNPAENKVESKIRRGRRRR